MNSPIILGQEDPMVQRAMQAEQHDRQLQAVVGQIQNQVLVACFTRLSLDHLQSGEPLTLESGRELADQAANVAKTVCEGYAGFLYEKLGLAKVGTVDKPEDVV